MTATLWKERASIEGVLGTSARGEIVKVRPGPVVTRYDLEPAPGTKTSRVVALSDDITLHVDHFGPCRRGAGTSTIGIELPNMKRKRSTYENCWPVPTTASKLPCRWYWQDIGGMPMTVDLARMPLLIAGDRLRQVGEDQHDPLAALSPAARALP